MTYKVAVNTISGSLRSSTEEYVNDKVDDLADRYTRLRAIDVNLDLENTEGPTVEVRAFIGVEDEDAAYVCTETAGSIVDAFEAVLVTVKRKLKEDLIQLKETRVQGVTIDRRPLWIGGSTIAMMIALFIVIRMSVASDTGRLAIYGSVSMDGSLVQHGSITLIPRAGQSGPAANTHISEGYYRFTKTNGPMPGTHELRISVAPDPAAIWSGYAKGENGDENGGDAAVHVEPSIHKKTVVLGPDARSMDITVPFP